MAADIQPGRDALERMTGYLGRIATGPTLSKDLSAEEAQDGMELILRDAVDPVQAGVFLIALRMKRESHEELVGVLRALRANAERAVAPVDELVDMAEPYNGYVRHLPSAPFMPAVLAACGVPCVLHGCREAGPKWGVTAHRILAAAGVRVDATSAEAAARVADAGWAYVDVRQYCPPLFALARLRKLIVKRPCLALLEKLVNPVQARESGRTHLWVGYAHREYPEILNKLSRAFGYHSMLAVRGVEGGVLTSLTGRVNGEHFVAPGACEPVVIDPRAALATVAEHRAPPLPSQPGAAGGPASGPPAPDRVDHWAEQAAAAGLAALAGRPGLTADMLVLGAAAVLRHLGKVDDLAAGAAVARNALANGQAQARLAAFV